MPHSITYYVDVSTVLGGSGVAAAGFGTPAFIFESAVSPGSRVHGPFTSAQAVVDFGYTEDTAPHLWAQAVFSQSPRVSQVYIIRRDAADADDADAFNAAVAENPAAFYCVNSANRDSGNILALAAAVEAASVPKIAILQCNDTSLPEGYGPSWSQTLGGVIADGDYDLVFTGFGLVAPETVRITRAAGVPAAFADIQTAMAAELTTQTGGGGDIEGVLDVSSIDATDETISFRITDGLPSGTVTAVLPGGVTGAPAETDADVGSRLFDLQYTRTALVYYGDDAVYLDGAWTSVGLSPDLDVRKGIWAYAALNGVEPSALTDLQVTALRNVNVNYFARAVATSGVETRAFTAQGWVSNGLPAAGRRIDTTITLDWVDARSEEAAASVLLSAGSAGVPTDAAGINRFAAAFQRVLNQGVDAKHFTRFVVPDDDPDFAGLSTPVVIAPVAASGRTLTFAAVAYTQEFAERVVFTINVRQP